MRKRLFLLIALLLTGCGFGAKPTPTPTPRPTATPTPAPRYYPTVLPQTSQEILSRVPKPKAYYRKLDLPDGQTYELFSLKVISSGKTDTIKAGQYELDVVWVYERSAAGVAQYPLVVGAWDGETYVPYYVGYAGEANRDAYLAYLAERKILERGRYLYPSVGDISGGYVSLYEGIDWTRCGDALYCELGRYMQETYGMDERVTHQLMGLDPIPEGWALAWMWDAATEENSDPAFIKIDLTN